MATEYKLSYTGSEINQKLGKVDNIVADVENLKTYVTPEMFGAKCDGVTDDTEAIISAMQTGKAVRFQSNGTYLIQGIALENDTQFYGNGCTILFSGYTPPEQGNVGFGVIDKHNITIDGFTIIPQNHVVSDIYIVNSTNIQIRNCDIQGNSVDDGGYHSNGSNQGVAIRGSKYITIENCSVQDIYATGIGILNSSHVLVSNCKIENTGRGGIFVAGGNTDINIYNNIVLNCVKNFTVEDGAIDVYGPTGSEGAIQNDTVRVIGNYVKGFGQIGDNGVSACGIRLKGSRNIICSENTVKTDTNTRIMAGIVVQDRYGTNVGYCVIQNNYIAIEECDDSHWTSGDFAYLIRVYDAEIAKNLLITGNTLTSTHDGVSGLSLRGKFDNLIISDNYIDVGNYYGINSINSADFIKKDVRVINNTFMGRVALCYCDGLHIYDNKITYSITDDYPLVIINSNNGYYGRNHIYGSDSNNHIYIAQCSNIYDCNDNILYDSARNVIKIIDITYPLATSKSANATIQNIYQDAQIDIKCFGDIIFEPSVSLNNIVDYTIFNEAGDYELIIDGETHISDSIRKLALKTTSLSDANYTNEVGETYLSDYRDWNNGVDWHLLHEVIFTGDEPLRQASFDSNKTIIFQPAVPYKPAHWKVDYDGYKTPYISNFYYNNDSYPISSDNNYITILYPQDHNFNSLDEFREFCRTQYASGTPLKLVYLLKTPYTTPIPEDELTAYNNIAITNGTTITNNYGKPFDITYMRDCAMTTAINYVVEEKVDVIINDVIAALPVYNGEVV